MASILMEGYSLCIFILLVNLINLFVYSTSVKIGRDVTAPPTGQNVTSSVNAVDFIGKGYDIFRGTPGSGMGDQGFLTTSTILGDMRCDSTVLCKTTAEVTKKTEYIRNVHDYRNALADHIVTVVPVSMPVNGTIGTLSFNYKNERILLESGWMFINYKTFTAQEEAKLGPTAKSRVLSESFANALCELPVDYDRRRFVNFLKLYGTHVIMKTQLGSSFVERLRVPPRIIEIAETARSNLLNDSSTDVLLEIESAQKNNPHLTRNWTIPHHVDRLYVRELALFVPKGSDAWKLKRLCQKYQTDGAIEKLRSSLRHALLDYASEVPQFTSGLDPQVKRNQEKKKSRALRSKTAFAALLHGNLSEIWPSGNYGLLQPTAECPGVGWHRGSLRHHLENDTSTFRTAIVTAGNISSLELNFCMRRSSFDGRQKHFPAGSYCVFRSPVEVCPQNFTEAELHIDNVRDSVEFYGRNPWVSDGKTGWYSFCCRLDSPSSVEVVLPKNRAFVLLPVSVEKKCQKVRGMDSKMEYIVFVADKSNASSKVLFIAGEAGPHVVRTRLRDVKMFLCHYTPKSSNEITSTESAL